MFSRSRTSPKPGTAILMLAGISLSACSTLAPAPHSTGRIAGTMRPYEVAGVWYSPRYQPDYDEVGLASWDGPESTNRRTADGEAFNVNALSAAHRTLPLPCVVEVTDLQTGRRIQVRVNDRGPFVAGRIIDLSPRAARELGIIGKGSARVRVRYVGPPPALTEDAQGGAAVPSGGRIHIQAGAYANRANADRAVAALASLGGAHIRTISRSGGELFMVELDCPAGAAPESIRQNVVNAGFPGARVLGPS